MSTPGPDPILLRVLWSAAVADNALENLRAHVEACLKCSALRDTRHCADARSLVEAALAARFGWQKTRPNPRRSRS